MASAHAAHAQPNDLVPSNAGIVVTPLICPTAVLERNITEEQAARDLKTVQDMWEMATALQLLKIIKLMRSSGIHTMGGKKYAESSYSMAMLEDAIVRSPGPGLLAEVHMVSAELQACYSTICRWNGMSRHPCPA